jgi:predicted regulator of Ras-like GTPase activity (Roadblock/LC7/MglB family)
MFDFVKKLFGKPERAPAPGPTIPFTAPLPPSAPAAAPKLAAPAAPKAAVLPAPVVPPPPPEMVYSKETVDLSLKALWPKLSEAVTKCATTQPKGDALLRLPLNLVQAHLAKGSLKIPLVQFRKFSPEGLFAADATLDVTEVVIPLSEVLPKLNPAHLARRPDQREVHVPEDIEPIFGTGPNGNLRIVSEKPKATASSGPAVKVAPVPVSPAPAVPAPAAAIPVSLPAPEPVPVAAPVCPPAVEAPKAAEPIRAPKLDPALATLRAPAAPIPIKAAPGVSSEKTVTLDLTEVSAYWAERGRVDLKKLSAHSVAFPVTAIAAALKKGKIEFTWQEVKPWLRLDSGAAPELKDETKIDFPLALLAPRFLTAMGAGKEKRRIEVSEEIPDVFVRHVPAVPPPPPPVPQAAEAPVDQENVSREFGEIFGQPEKKEWSLGEVTQRATKLPGVAGAIIATSDGLLIWGSWPNGVGGEAVAAFVPQIYNRLTNYTHELKLGNPGSFTLLVENVPLQIFKSADSYFTVLGRAGESLPAKELKAIATRLAATATAN